MPVYKYICIIIIYYNYIRIYIYIYIDYIHTYTVPVRHHLGPSQKKTQTRKFTPATEGSSCGFAEDMTGYQLLKIYYSCLYIYIYTLW